MMDDLELKCANARKPGDGVKFVDNDCGEIYISAEDDGQRTEIILSRNSAESLLEWITEYLR